MYCGGSCQPLIRRHLGFDGKMSKARRLSDRTLDALRIAHQRAKHLIATANAQNLATAPQMRGDVNVPALRTRKRQIPQRRFRSRNNDQVGVGRDHFAGTHHGQTYPRFLHQRVDVVEVRDAGQDQDRNLVVTRSAAIVQIQGIFCGQFGCTVEIRHHAEPAPSPLATPRSVQLPRRDQYRRSE